MVHPVVLVGGFLLLLVGAVLLVPLPEAGIPAVLVSLRILGRRFAWAHRANVRFDAAVGAGRRRLRAVPRHVRFVIKLVLAILVLWFVWAIVAR